MSSDRSRPARHWRHAALPFTFAALLAQTGLAHAQSVDYGSMEQLFGGPITTSATGSPQQVTEAPADMTIVPQDDIRRSGADNLPDVLALVPGIEIARNSFGDAEIAIRGYDTVGSNRLLVLLNGRPVYDDFYGFVAWGNIPVALTDIRQIEVVRGPNSALFGFDAAAGVINIITYDPLYDNINTADVRTGTQALADGEAVATADKPGKWGFRLSATGQRANEFDATSTDVAAIDHPVSAGISAEGRYVVRPGLELTVEGGVSNNTYELASAIPQALALRSNYIRTLVAAQTGIGQVDVSFYRNETNFNYVTNDTDVLENVYDGQLSDTVKIGASNIVRGGLEFQDNSADSARLLQGTFGYDDYAGSLMWNWQFAPAWSLTNAVRYDFLDFNFSGASNPPLGYTPSNVGGISHNGVTFNSGLVWSPTERDTFRLLAARGLQLPSIFDLGADNEFAPPLAENGDPALQPTAVTSVELSYDRTLKAIASTLHADVFGERNDDLATDPLQDPPRFIDGVIYLGDGNIGHSDEVGSEIAISGSLPHSLRWDLSYSLASIADHVEAGIAPSIRSYYAQATPRHTVIAKLGYTTGRWELDTSARWQSHYEAPASAVATSAPIPIDGFLTFDARAAYNLTKHVEVSLSGIQLLRSRIPETPGLEVDRRVIAALTVHL